MSSFRSRWDDWIPKTPSQRTDGTDKSPSVSFVSSSSRRFEKNQGATGGVVERNIGEGIASQGLLERPDRFLGTPSQRTDGTDKRVSAGKAVLVRLPNGAPLEWGEGVAKLLTMPTPWLFDETRWEALQEDAFAFLRDWAAQACQLGWTDMEVFGVHPHAPQARLDCLGIVPSLSGNRVAVLTAEGATIITERGERQSFRRLLTAPAEEVCLIWNIGANEEPPP